MTLILSLLVVPLAVEAQPAHVPRIDVLSMEGGPAATPERLPAEFREALRERGYVEGQNILVEYRWVTAGQTERLDALAVELVQLQVDLIMALSTPAVHTAKRATTAIPWAQASSRASHDRAGTSRA
jgi:putative ABC transport system substrate-binding protein